MSSTHHSHISFQAPSSSHQQSQNISQAPSQTTSSTQHLQAHHISPENQTLRTKVKQTLQDFLRLSADANEAFNNYDTNLPLGEYLDSLDTQNAVEEFKARLVEDSVCIKEFLEASVEMSGQARDIEASFDDTVAQIAKLADENRGFGARLTAKDEEIRQRDERIEGLELDVKAKEDRIKQLEAELEKRDTTIEDLRSASKPLTPEDIKSFLSEQIDELRMGFDEAAELDRLRARDIRHQQSQDEDVTASELQKKLNEANSMIAAYQSIYDKIGGLVPFANETFKAKESQKNPSSPGGRPAPTGAASSGALDREDDRLRRRELDDNPDSTLRRQSVTSTQSMPENMKSPRFDFESTQAFGASDTTETPTRPEAGPAPSARKLEGRQGRR